MKKITYRIPPILYCLMLLLALGLVRADSAQVFVHPGGFCNAWSSKVNTVPSSTGLVGISIFDFALAAEVLRTYSGWAPADFSRSQNMVETYLYPSSHDFLTRHNGACITS